MLLLLHAVLGVREGIRLAERAKENTVGEPESEQTVVEEKQRL